MGVLKKILMKNIDKYKLQTEAQKNIEALKRQRPRRQKIEIKVLGVTMSKKINVEENEEKEKRIGKLIQKDNCQNIFKDMGNGSGVDSMTHQQYVNYKFEKKTKEIILNKIRLLMNMKIISGDIFVKSIISKIEILKELLILDVQLGMAVYLCDEFNMNQLPLSFRYYDPILRIILKGLNPQRQRFYMDQKHLAKMFHEQSTHQQFLKVLGLKEDKDEGAQKQVIKHKPVNLARRKEIDFNFSKHAMQIQRSYYVKIDDDTTNPVEKIHSDFRQRDPELYTNISNTGYTKEMRNQTEGNSLDLKFMDPREVNQSRQNFLMLKQKFLLRQSLMKSYGDKGLLMARIESWIDSRIDEIFDHFRISTQKKDIQRRISRSLTTMFQKLQ